MKAQMKAADKSGARYALILGDDELAKGVVALRNLTDGAQQELAEMQAIALLLENK
jgi:histidyl-tRNA synthetase